MDANKTLTETTNGKPLAATRAERRRRSSAAGENARYFLPKTGSSPDRPELGQEVANEGEALVQAFKNGQVFYTVLAWKAVPEMNGDEPKIVREVHTR